MNGVIRMILGASIMFGVVGTLDLDPSADLLTQTLLALGGGLLLISGSLANQRQRNG
jgi:hypothetical protein